MIKLFEAEARLQYYSDYCVAYVDQGIVDFYRSLIPKAYRPKPQMWPAHITVSRKNIEKPKRLDVWKKYDGQSVKFTYSNEIHSDGLYYWLNVWSDSIGRIREELGLSFYREPFTVFHLTLGNMKDA